MKSCRECEAILLECRRAYRDFWLNATPETRNLFQSVASLIGGTEEDVARVESLALPFRVSAEQVSMEHWRKGSYLGTSGSERIRDEMGRKIKHQMATGHFVKFAIGGDFSESGGREGDVG